jgi:hypothetical protein
MSRWPLLVLLSLFAGHSLRPAHPENQRTQLLSIVDVHLEKNEYLLDFQIETAAVSLLAICHRPVGWSLTISAPDEQFGEIVGEEGLYHYRNSELDVFRDLFLVRVIPSNDETLPNFKGTIHSITFATSIVRTIPLRPSNIALRSAARCPDP